MLIALSFTFGVKIMYMNMSEWIQIILLFNEKLNNIKIFIYLIKWTNCRNGIIYDSTIKKFVQL